ncbi:cyclic peptide transporter [Chitinophaga sp. MD30]|nr:cyclic peptide transporter [Chitinophaga sp. MD30]
MTAVFSFIGLILLSFIASSYFQQYMVTLTNEIMCDIELSIIGKVRHASYGSFEQLGSEKIYAAISDARILSRIPGVFITLINATVTIICGLAYLFYTSFVSGAVLLSIMAILLTIYVYRDRQIEKDLNVVRDLQDVYYDHLRELLHGFKQIKISAKRSNNLFDKHIYVNRHESKTLNTKAAKRYAVNELSGIYSWYVVLGIILFLLPVLMKIDVIKVTAFITTVLFMMAPLSQVILFLPAYTSFRIAIRRINRIDQQLEADALSDTGWQQVRAFETIRFEDIVYRYGDGAASFTLEIPSLTLSKGEIVFITGGNGSGKTTFINLLTGLYRPDSGRVYIDDELVDWPSFSVFGNNMSVVYTNHHLFKSNYDEHDLGDDNRQLHRYTEQFNLTGILKVDPVRKQVDVNLSKGQQKRLALVLSLLEDKPLIILDEWAAEQDPQNRSTFYHTWLQQIRDSGKTILAVTHDDDFFDLADRTIKFNAGRIVHDHYNKIVNQS